MPGLSFCTEFWADEWPLLLRMFRSAVYGLVMDIPLGTRIRVEPASLPSSLSLESRLGLLRRRRRVSFLKQLLAVCPLAVGMSLLLFAAVGGASSLR